MAMDDLDEGDAVGHTRHHHSCRPRTSPCWRTRSSAHDVGALENVYAVPVRLGSGSARACPNARCESDHCVRDRYVNGRCEKYRCVDDRCESDEGDALLLLSSAP